MELYTWDGVQSHLRKGGPTVTNFNAKITAYTDIIGYGMYIEITASKDLDEYVGYLVHNTPDHVGTSPADLTGFFWVLKLNKIAEDGDKRYRYSLTDLTWGQSDKWKLYEPPLTGNSSRFIHALMNANPDSTNLFIDGETTRANTQYLNRIDDSKTNIFYSGENDDGVERGEVVTWLKSMRERATPKLQQKPSFTTGGGNGYQWYVNPFPDFKKVQSYDYMLDEWEVEEIVDQNTEPPYTAVRQWAYWQYKDPNNPNNITEDKTKVSIYTQYIDDLGNINSYYIRQAPHQDVYGYPIFFGTDPNTNAPAGIGRPPKAGSTRFMQLQAGQSAFYDFSGSLATLSAFSKSKSYKIYRALDINQYVFYKNQPYIVSEVDYINEVSVIGGTTGVI